MAVTDVYNLRKNFGVIPIRKKEVTSVRFYRDHPSLFTIEQKRYDIVLERDAYYNHLFGTKWAEWIDKGFIMDPAHVDNIAFETPYNGFIVISDHDGKTYYADGVRWYQQGNTSPIVLYVEYDGVTQFDFRFKAPITSTLDIYDGDGTMTQVAGNDTTTVTHTTNYAAAGTYYFYVEGDITDITLISIVDQPVTSDVSRWSELVNLESVGLNGSGLSGSISSWETLASLSNVTMEYCSITGDASGLENLTAATFNFTNVYGDISNMVSYPITIFISLSSGFTFDSISAWTLGGTFFAIDQNWTSTMVDNCLISLANGGTTGKTINLAGNNASRSAASNDAMVALLVAGNTVTVNEDLRYIDTPIRLTVDFDGTTQFDFKFKAPLGSYLIMYDGDGTRTLVQGNDATLVTHTTNYATAGEYTFIVVGDLADVTMLDLQGMTFISGSISDYSLLSNLDTLFLSSSPELYGSINSYGDLSNLNSLALMKLYLVTGDIGSISGTPVVIFTGRDTKLTGDLAQLATTDLLGITLFGSTGITFDTIVSWTSPLVQLITHDCLWTTEMVDNCLISLANGGVTGATIKIGGNNAARTPASNAALHTLEQAGNTVTVNENLGPESLDNGNFSNWTGDNPDDWSVRTEDANNYITEVSGQARMVTDGDFMYMYQLKLTIGKYYITTVEITESALGSVLIGDLSVPANQKSITGVGVHEFRFIAEGATYGISQDGACDITMAVASLKEVI